MNFIKVIKYKKKESHIQHVTFKEGEYFINVKIEQLALTTCFHIFPYFLSHKSAQGS